MISSNFVYWGGNRLGFEVWGIPIKALAPIGEGGGGGVAQDVGDAKSLERNCV